MSGESSLLSEWTKAVENGDLERIKELHQGHPKLLWSPLARDITQDTDRAHLVAQLQHWEILGASLQPLYALQYILLDHLEDANGEITAAQKARTELLSYFIKHTRTDDLNTRYWGCNNTTLHLASFLDLPNVVAQLMEKGASPNIPNDMGYFPKDVCQPEMLRLLDPPEDEQTDEEEGKEEENVQNRTQVPKKVDNRMRPNYATNDRFKQLRQLAESPAEKKAVVDRQNSTRRYFRPGHVEERKKKVLNDEEEAELEKQRLARQQEVARLAQKSAVKNNPLLKKLEKQQVEPHTPEKQVSALQKYLAVAQAADHMKRQSKVISSLQNKSYVSSSVFRQIPSDTSIEQPVRSPSPAFSKLTDNSDGRQDVDTEQLLHSSERMDTNLQKEKKDIEKDKQIDSEMHYSNDVQLMVATGKTDDETVSDKINPMQANLDHSKSQLELVAKEPLDCPTKPGEISHDNDHIAIIGEHNNTRSMIEHIEKKELAFSRTQEDTITAGNIINNRQVIQRGITEPNASQEAEHMKISSTTAACAEEPLSCKIPRSEKEEAQTNDDISTQSVDDISKAKKDEQPTYDIGDGVEKDNISLHSTNSVVINENETSNEEINCMMKESSELTTPAPVNDDYTAQDILSTPSETINKPSVIGEEINDIKDEEQRINTDGKCTLSIPYDDTSANAPSLENIANGEETNQSELANTAEMNEEAIEKVQEAFEQDNEVEEQSDESDEKAQHENAEHSNAKDKEYYKVQQAITEENHIRAEDDDLLHQQPGSLGETEDSDDKKIAKDDAASIILEESMKQKDISQVMQAEEMRRLSGSQRSHWSSGIHTWENVMKRESMRSDRKSLAQYSESDSELWFDSHEEWLEHEEARKSLTMSLLTDNKEINVATVNEQEPIPKDTSTTEQKGHTALEQGVIEKRTSNESIHHQTARSVIEEDVDDTQPSDNETIRGFVINKNIPPKEKMVTVRLSDDTSVQSPVPSSFSSHRVSVSESIDTSAPPSPQDTKPTVAHIVKQESCGNVTVGPTCSYVRPISRSEEAQPKDTTTTESIQESIKIELAPQYQYQNKGTPELLDVSMAANDAPKSPVLPSNHGKLYIHVSGAHNLLLPLPKEVTYVRCVVSDGRYEYMSRYEVLGQEVLLDYECIVDAVPDMIITVALHVRPDYHVKPRTGLSAWFTSIRKQKESLCGYVHPEDGAIGQARFALAHMQHACHQKVYQASFDCFNSWYARTARERQRRQQYGAEEDVLKVVGNLSVEMLYLPVSDPTLPVPRNLRECDLALKIRQWHETCWQSGYLSTRPQSSSVWQRRYYRLIGSQFVGYESQERSWKPVERYDIADAVRLSVAAEQTLVTLVDMPDKRVFQPETICADNRRGFFRLAFPEFHIDCVCDEVEQSEEWVKALRSMIGRVPLKLPFSV
ncbi:Bud site selection protein bud4 [Apophysomyces ossiformis]|uniref:Bud site selection protein bud4 n=1 Tax=Apophysomyces ossiformis TaxID=679940 RepID=A0A8H7ETQ8_9FUNG|nr:Bud site selection protein bud4 [Apophysomyces ossiformis]